MKKFVFVVCLFSVLYLAYHFCIYAANAEYRNRMNDPEYLSGNKIVTYYKP